MDRAEFMRQLEHLLQDIAEAERMEALEYYESYFEDAGPEKEAQVIRELGSPGKVAAIIKADLQENGSGSGDYGEYTERGYEDARTRERSQVPDSYTQTARAGRGYHARGRNKSTLILLVILLVFASPILLGIGGGIFGILVGLAGGIVGLIAGLFGLMIGAVFGGVGLVIGGIVECFATPSLGLAGIGIGFFCLAVGMLLLIAVVWMLQTGFPWIIRKLSGLVHRLTHKVKEVRGGAGE